MMMMVVVVVMMMMMMKIRVIVCVCMWLNSSNNFDTFIYRMWLWIFRGIEHCGINSYTPTSLNAVLKREWGSFGQISCCDRGTSMEQVRWFHSIYCTTV